MKWRRRMGRTPRNFYNTSKTSASMSPRPSRITPQAAPKRSKRYGLMRDFRLTISIRSKISVVSLSLRDAQSQSQGTNVSGQQVYPGRSLGHDSRATSPLSRPEQSSLWPWLVSEDTIHADLWIRLSYHVN